MTVNNCKICNDPLSIERVMFALDNNKEMLIGQCNRSDHSYFINFDRKSESFKLNYNFLPKIFIFYSEIRSRFSYDWSSKKPSFGVPRKLEGEKNFFNLLKYILNRSLMQ